MEPNDDHIVWLDDAGAPSAPEDLPGQDRPPMRRRTRVVLGAVAAAAIGGVIAAVALDHGGAPAPQAAATSSPSAPALPSTFDDRQGITITLDPSDGRVTHFTVEPPEPRNPLPDQVGCSGVGAGESSCRLTDTVPAAVRAALQAVIPSARVSTVHSLYSRRDGLDTRHITAHAAHGEKIVIVVGHATGADAHGSFEHTNQHEVVGAADDVGRYRVSVTATAPVRRSTPLPTLLRLARDTRLTAGT